MGLILDSSVLIGAERSGLNASQLLRQISETLPGEEVAVSVVTLIELAHGVARANTTDRKAMRQGFLDELMSVVPVHWVSGSMALRAGRIDGEGAARGMRPALADLLIGVTALELGYRVATANVRHFEMIPGLEVVRF